MYTTTRINNLPIIEIENFLTDKELNEILNPRILNFKKAISHYPSYYRNNDRLVEDNPELSEMLYDKLKQLDILDKETKTKSIGLNEKLRFCKYQKDQLFSKHQDGIYYPDAFSESKFTFLLYLNDNKGFEGGNTDFYTLKTDNNPIKTIVPKKGKLIVFDHRLWHKGALVTKGDKYILRSDIIIKRQTKNTHHDGYIWNLVKLNKNQLLSCGRDTSIKLWDTNLQLQKILKIHSKSVLKVVRLTATEFISCSRDFTLKRWSISGQILASTTLDEMILTIKINADKNIIAAGTSGKLYLLNTALSVIKTIKIHKGWIWGLSIKDNDTVLTCGEDGTVHFTNTRLEKTTCIYKNKQPLFCLSILRKNMIFVGSHDGTIIQISLDTQNIYKIKAHDDSIRSIIYYENSIISCGEDNKVVTVDLQSYKVEEIFKSDNFVQDIIRIKNIVYIAGYNGMITTKSL